MIKFDMATLVLDPDGDCSQSGTIEAKIDNRVCRIPVTRNHNDLHWTARGLFLKYRTGKYLWRTYAAINEDGEMEWFFRKQWGDRYHYGMTFHFDEEQVQFVREEEPDMSIVMVIIAVLFVIIMIIAVMGSANG